MSFYLRGSVPVYDSKVSPSRGEPNVKVLSLIIQEVEFNDLKCSLIDFLIIYHQ